MKPIHWWGLLVVLVLVLIALATREAGSGAEKERAEIDEIDKIVIKTRAVAERIRCIEDRAWMRAAPEAEEARAYLRLVELGREPDVKPEKAVLDRLAAAKACGR